MSLASFRQRAARPAVVALMLLLSAAAFMPSSLVRLGHAHELGGELAHSSRIVAIGGSITEIVYALGLEDRLAARDSTSVFPPAAARLPDVGYMRQLSAEGVLSLDPDAILALEGSGPPETIEVLRKASVPFVSIPERFDGEGIVDKIQQVGKALGAPEKADALAASVGAELEAAQMATSDIGERKRVLFVLSMQGGKILASGQGTAADGIIAMAGGINALIGFQGYKQLNDEAVIEARPDLILMMRRGGELDLDDTDLLANPALAATPAGKAKNIARMDGAYLLGFGPRTAGAVRELSEALYGEQKSN